MVLCFGRTLLWGRHLFFVSIKKCHGPHGPKLEGVLYGIHGPVKWFLQGGPFLGGELAQDVVHHTAPRRADPEPQPGERIRAKVGDERLHPVVPPGRAALPHPQLAAGQVLVIVDDQALVRRQPVKPGQRHHGLAAQVHKRQRFDQVDAARLPHLALPLGLFGKDRAKIPRQTVEDEKPDIVPGVLILAPWIPQTCDESNVSHGCRVPAS